MTLLALDPANAKTMKYDPPIAAGHDNVGECPAKYRATAPDGESSPKPLFRCPPLYPERCVAKGHSKDGVVVIYDIDADGVPFNTRVAGTTNVCLNDAAADSVLRWRFEPSESGAKDVATTISFELR